MCDTTVAESIDSFLAFRIHGCCVWRRVDVGNSIIVVQSLRYENACVTKGRNRRVVLIVGMNRWGSYSVSVVVEIVMHDHHCQQATTHVRRWTPLMNRDIFIQKLSRDTITRDIGTLKDNITEYDDVIMRVSFFVFTLPENSKSKGKTKSSVIW